MMKKIVSLLLTAIILATMLTVFALPASAAEPDYLCLTSTGDTTIGFSSNRFPSSPDYKLEYSVNGGEWMKAGNTDTIPLKNGESVRFRANGTAGMFSSTKYLNFTMSGSGTVAASGSVMSLLDGSKCCEYCFNCLFENCTALTTAPALPATTLASSCYESMFYNCTALTTAPALPATTLASKCYYSMFKNCTALITAPALPATTLADFCYNWMFGNCTSLTAAPALPATTLAVNCYRNMFCGCTALTTAPALSATTPEMNCYNGMFDRCTALIITAEKPTDGCYNEIYIPDADESVSMFRDIPNAPIPESGKTYYCCCPCPHDHWDAATGRCTACGKFECEVTGDHAYENGVCSVCNVKGCEIGELDHSFVNGVCSVCNVKGCEIGELDHNWDAATGKCTVCQYECPHDGNTCVVCGAKINGGSLALGSALSEGNLTIIVGVACLAVGFLAAMFIFKKKKTE